MVRLRLQVIAVASALAALIPFAASAAPSISAVSPANATTNVPVTFTASVSSGTPIQVCKLYVDLEDVGEMTVSGGIASRSYTFTSGGSRIAFVFCRDTSGSAAAGPNTSIWVEGAIVASPPLSTPSPAPTPVPTPIPAASPTSTAVLPGTLIKLACAAGALSDDPCRAVYYYSRDGKRHAFPNSKVYFTWYADFSGVVEVSAAAMSGFPLGKNVTYRPGLRMVKFTTDPKVYVVGHAGVLRWVTSEGSATTLYGSDWNTKIDDIADVFYTNYTFGSDVNGSGEFNPSDEAARAAAIDDNS